MRRRTKRSFYYRCGCANTALVALHPNAKDDGAVVVCHACGASWAFWVARAADYCMELVINDALWYIVSYRADLALQENGDA